MSEGASTVTVNAVLDAMLSGTSYTGNSNIWVQLHTGAPGTAGTTNIAGNSTRQQCTTFASASGGTKVSTASVTWTSVSTAETYTKVTLWTLVTGGTFITSGSITASTVAIGDTFVIPSGNLTAALPTAS